MKLTLRQGLRTDGAAILYSIKCYLSAMLAYYIGLRIGLDRPYWAMITCYVTASPQPLAGAILGKSIARVIGTVLGSAVAVALVPNLVNVPAALVLAMSVWLGLCTWLALLDGTPRSYMFVLAGYTASIVGFRCVNAPGTIFDVAVLRVQEIFLGILCTSLLHGAFLPRTVTRQLQIRVEQILADTKRWVRQSLVAGNDPTIQRQLTLEISELLNLSLLLPFDTARELPSGATVDALRDRVTALLPLVSSMPKGPPQEVQRVVGWLDTGNPPADVLIGELGAPLSDVVTLLRDAYALRDRIERPGDLPAPAELVVIKKMHPAPGRKYSSAAWTGLGAALSVALACAIWILTAWPSGSTLAIYVGIQCALFGGLPKGDRAVIRFLCGASAGVVAALLYAYTILPRVSDPVLLAVTAAPILLVIGSVLARPSTAVQGVSASIGFLSAVGFVSSYHPDFASSVNDSIALLAGVGCAVMMVRLFQLAEGGQER